MIEIRLIEHPADLQQVFRLRYAVYVEELGAAMKHADHQLKELHEPWDETGNNLGAWINGELAGCIRLNCGGATDLAEYWRFFASIIADQGAGCALESVSVSSKFAVHRKYRGTSLGVRLALACYALMHEKGARLNYLTCRPNLAEKYRKLGFQTCAPAFIHHEAGWSLPMVLIVQDYEYLRQIKSPFAEICARYPIKENQAKDLRAIYDCALARCA